MKRNAQINDAIAMVDDGRSVLITGRAGTGKSTLLAHIRSRSRRGTAVVAPTGVAALNVGGQTVHRFFSFPISVTPDDLRSGAVAPRRNLDFIAGLERLIIDEVSMIRADLMDCIDIALRKWGPDRRKPFGGVQMVFVGDPYQLPPVVRREEATYFSNRYPTPYFFSADAFRSFDYETIELTEVFRQRDTGFIEVLNAVREDAVTDEQLASLNARVDSRFVPPTKEVFITLASTRRLADEVNEERLGRLPGQLYTSTAAIVGDVPTHPTKPDLRFKKKAQVMMLTNDPGEQWVNGSLGVIESVDLNEPSVRVRIAESGRLVDVEPFEWTVTKPTVKKGNLAYTAAGTFKQFPFDLAWAVTIHKSQGKSFDHVVVDLGTGAFAEGQLYVALSRARSLDGLILRRPIRRQDIKVHPAVVQFFSPQRAVSPGGARGTDADPGAAIGRIKVARIPKGRHIERYSHLELRAIVRHLDPDGTLPKVQLIDAACTFLGYPGRTPGRTELITRAIKAERKASARSTAAEDADDTGRGGRGSLGRRGAGSAGPQVNVKRIPKGRHIERYSHLELRAIVRHLDPDGTLPKDQLIDAACTFLGYPGRTPGRTELITRAIKAERQANARLVAEIDRDNAPAADSGVTRTRRGTSGESSINVKRIPKGRHIERYSHLELRAIVRHLDPDSTLPKDQLIDAVCTFLGYPGRTPGRTELITRAIKTERRSTAG